MKGGEAVLVLLLIIGLFAFAFTALILRHRRKMALIERGINPEEPNPLKTYRRALVFLCIAVASLLLAAINGGNDQSGFWLAVSFLTSAFGFAYMLYYRVSKKQAASGAATSQPAKVSDGDQPKQPPMVAPPKN